MNTLSKGGVEKIEAMGPSPKACLDTYNFQIIDIKNYEQKTEHLTQKQKDQALRIK